LNNEEDNFNYVKSYSLDSMNLEELFWNMNEGNMSKDFWISQPLVETICFILFLKNDINFYFKNESY